MPATDRPNVVFLFTDDQRFDTIGALGNPHIHTPNLDALVADGTAMTRAYIFGGSTGAVCMPSRAMLHTGRSLYHITRQGQTIDPAHTMLAEHFRAAGYRTFGAGKWHNSPEAYSRCFTDGAEIFFGGMNDHWNVPACHFRPDGDWPEPRTVLCRFGQKLTDVKCIYDHIPSGTHSTDLLAGATARWIREYDDDAPFLTYTSFLAPHDPREMPQRFLALYHPDNLPLPENFKPGHPFDNGELMTRDEMLARFPRTPVEVRKHLAEYYAMISHIDDQVGQVVAALKETGRYENTIIVFAGDNGLAVGQHGLIGKQSIYEHSVHVPLLLAGPGVGKNQQSPALCNLIDIYPTLCDLAGLETPDTVEGQSFTQCLADPTADHRDAVLLAYRCYQRGVREDRFKLIEYVVCQARHTQLFDLHEDPAETNNLADDPAHAETLERLRKLLRRWPEELDDDQFEQGAVFWQGQPDPRITHGVPIP